MSAAERVFQKLWRPEVLFILMLIAVYGIIGELTTPGAILPGVVGAIALVLALYLAAVLPVNVTGLLLIVLAILLLGEQRELSLAFYGGVAIILAAVAAYPLLHRLRRIEHPDLLAASEAKGMVD